MSDIGVKKPTMKRCVRSACLGDFTLQYHVGRSAIAGRSNGSKFAARLPYAGYPPKEGKTTDVSGCAYPIFTQRASNIID